MKISKLKMSRLCKNLTLSSSLSIVRQKGNNIHMFWITSNIRGQGKGGKVGGSNTTEGGRKGVSNIKIEEDRKGGVIIRRKGGKKEWVILRSNGIGRKG